MGKYVTFGMEWKVYGNQTIKLPEHIDENNKDEVKAYLESILPEIELPANYEYLVDSDVLDFEEMKISFL